MAATPGAIDSQTEHRDRWAQCLLVANRRTLSALPYMNTSSPRQGIGTMHVGSRVEEVTSFTSRQVL